MATRRSTSTVELFGSSETDQSRWSHRFIRPPARVLSRVAVALIVVVKRVLPFEFSSHRLLDRLGIWFMSRFVSKEGRRNAPPPFRHRDQCARIHRTEQRDGASPLFVPTELKR